MKEITHKHAKVRAKSNLDDKLDKLFDISPCTCSLEMVPCNDILVKCTASNCIQDHILCICATSAEVPPEERAYLRDHRLKIGPKKRAFQMAYVDQAAAKKALAAEKRQQKHDQGACEEGIVLPKQLECSESISSSSSSSIHEVSRMGLDTDFFV